MSINISTPDHSCSPQALIARLTLLSTLVNSLLDSRAHVNQKLADDGAVGSIVSDNITVKIANNPTKAITPVNAANAPTQNALVRRNFIVITHGIKGSTGAKNHNNPKVRSVDITPANRPAKS